MNKWEFFTAIAILSSGLTGSIISDDWEILKGAIIILLPISFLMFFVWIDRNFW